MGDYDSFKRYTDKVVQDCTGYCSTPSTSIWLLPWLTGCRLTFWLLAGLSPYVATHMLTACHLDSAEYVLVKLIDGRQRLCHVRCLRLAAVPRALQNTLEREGGAYEGQEQLRVFKLFRRKYVYHPTQQTFKPVDAMPAHLPRQIFAAMEALRAINLAGDSWKDFNTAQVLTRRNMVVMYGNKRQLFQPNKIADFFRHMYPSVFMVQILEVVYLIYRAYYWLPFMLLSLTGAAGVILIVTLRRQRLKVMALVNHCRLTPIVQAGWVRAVSSHTLVPGDVVVLQRGKAMCDMVLLQGACLVVESMLSGEAAQVRKAAFVPEDGVRYNPDRHQSCSVYAGTTVQQVWNPEDAEDEVLAMVCRTGLNTQMGSMVRELVTPTTLSARKDNFVKDTFQLYAFAFSLQLLNLIPFAWRASVAYPQTPGAWVIKLLDTLTHSAPPSIPTVFLVLTYIARLRLDRAGISLLYSKALHVGAYVNMVCFDKTGTLTDSVAALHGVLPVQEGQFESLQQNALRWNNRLRQALAVCNGLSWINKTLVGVDMERSMFKAVEARFLDRDIVVLPRKPDHVSDSRTAKLTITKTLEFSSQTLRSGVVVMADDALPGSALLFIRGAPGIIKDLVQPSSVPVDFEQVSDGFSSNSFRLMAMAVGTIPDVHQLDLLRMTQQQVEAHVTHMELLGLMVLTNNIRSDSKSTITELQAGGGIRTMMITGDYHHTAIAVARDVGMLSTDAKMIIVDIARSVQPHADPQGQSPQGFYPQGPAGSAQRLFGEALGHNAETPATPRATLDGLKFIQAEGNLECEAGWAVTALAEGRLQCTMTGDAFDHVLQLGDTSLLESVMRNAVVFARMKPHQKGQVVDLLSATGIHQQFDGQPRHIQGYGNRILFCGDGINDLNALSAADVGLAVGSTDAIVAASLSTHRGSVAGVCSFLRASRAAHSLTSSLFKYMVLYQCCLSIAQNISFCFKGSRLATSQVVAIDFQALTLAFTACLLPPLKQLNRHQIEPVSTVPTFILLSFMALMAALVQVVNIVYLSSQPWFQLDSADSTHEDPAVTLAWLVANFELLGPLVSLVIDTKNVCEPALRFKPIFLLTSFYLATAYIAVLGRPDGWGNTFAQYDFPGSFKEHFAWSITVEATTYGVMTYTLRLVLQRFRRRKCAPA
ncbi:hypothetical protein WJX79_002152 [Trebouxia sp. C0005]